MSTGPDLRGRVAWALALVATGVALAGCAQPSAVAIGDGDEAARWQAVTACIRANGMPDWPDPVVGPDGRLGFPVDAPHTTDRVQRACSRQFAAVSSYATSSAAPASTADIGRLVHFAQCLRRHGFPGWPDPGSDGRFPYAAVTAQPGAKDALTRPPAACRSFIPQGGVHVGS